jgi:hypothetical protein
MRANTQIAPWKHWLVTLGLVIAYAPSYLVPSWVRRSQFEIATQLSYGWQYCAYVFISLTLVSPALVLAVLGPPVVKARPLAMVRLFLLANWLPHSLCALALTYLYYPSAWPV